LAVDIQPPFLASADRCVRKRRKLRGESGNCGDGENDFSISLEQNILLIRGIRPDTGERRAYHQMEISFGEFLTTVEFQVPIDTDKSGGISNGFYGFTCQNHSQKSSR
jgi:hypothetical protein